jgi:hypothetical protein
MLGAARPGGDDEQADRVARGGEDDSTTSLLGGHAVVTGLELDGGNHELIRLPLSHAEIGEAQIRDREFVPAATVGVVARELGAPDVRVQRRLGVLVRRFLRPTTRHQTQHHDQGSHHRIVPGSNHSRTANRFALPWGTQQKKTWGGAVSL